MTVMVVASTVGRIISNLGSIARNAYIPKAALTKSSLFILVRLYANNDTTSKNAANIPVAKSSDSERSGPSPPISLIPEIANKTLSNITYPPPRSLKPSAQKDLQICLASCPTHLDDTS